MKGNYKHGGRHTRLYDIWRHMKSRCTNANDKKYHRYGGRGVKVCQEWLDFATFREWALSNGYDDNLTIDRINNDGDYTASNCKWSTAKEQANNRGYRIDTTVITWNGETHSLAEWSTILDIKYNTLLERKRRGWGLPELFAPVHHRRVKNV